MIYQGHLVNFSQVSDSQFKGLVTAVGQTNYQVATNSRNLVNMGKDMTTMGVNMTKIGQDNTYFGTAITNLDTAVRQLISTGTGGSSGMTQQQVVDIVEDYHGDDILLLHNNSMSLGAAQQAAKLQRDSMEAKIQSNKDEHEDFHTKLQSLGDKMLNHSNSPHNQGGGNGGIMSYLPVLAAGGIAAYFLLKGKRK